MRSITLRIIACLMWICVATAYGQTFDKLISQAENYENLLETGIARFRITTSQFDSATVIEDITCTFKGDSYFSECTHNYKKNDNERTFIRTTVVTSDKHEVLTRKLPENTVNRAEIYDPQRPQRNDDFALSHGMRIHGVKVSDFLRGTYFGGNPVTSVKLLGTESITGSDCYVVRMHFNNNDMILNAWLSKEHQLKPLQITETYPNHEDDVRSIITFQYSLQKDVWCSEKVVARLFRNDTLISEHIVDFMDFDVNIPVDDQVFAWSLPEGTETYDYRTNSRIVIQ